MPRGYHDWLSPETQGALRTYVTVFEPGAAAVPFSARFNVFNPVGSNTICRLTRLEQFAFSSLRFASGLTFTITVFRTTSLGTGAVRAIGKFDTLDLDSVCQGRQLFTADPTVSDNLLQGHVDVVAREYLNPFSEAERGKYRVIYEYFADGRRQPISFRPGEGIGLFMSVSDTNGEVKWRFEHTEEPLS